MQKNSWLRLWGMVYSVFGGEKMYTSGQFAAMFRVSKKLLRHYNEIGLLTPSEIDQANGYSYYGEIERELMKQIMYLRALQMPLHEIIKLINLPK